MSPYVHIGKVHITHRLFFSRPGRPPPLHPAQFQGSPKTLPLLRSPKPDLSIQKADKPTKEVLHCPQPQSASLRLLNEQTQKPRLSVLSCALPEEKLSADHTRQPPSIRTIHKTIICGGRGPYCSFQASRRPSADILESSSGPLRGLEVERGDIEGVLGS